MNVMVSFNRVNSANLSLAEEWETFSWKTTETFLDLKPNQLLNITYISHTNNSIRPHSICNSRLHLFCSSCWLGSINSPTHCCTHSCTQGRGHHDLNDHLRSNWSYQQFKLTPPGHGHREVHVTAQGSGQLDLNNSSYPWLQYLWQWWM